MENKELKIEQRKEKDTLFCKLFGWLDPNTSPDLLNSVDLTNIKHLVLDLEGVEYVFSSGLRVMLLFQYMLESQGGDIKLVNVPDSIRFIFEDTGLEGMLETPEE